MEKGSILPTGYLQAPQVVIREFQISDYRSIYILNRDEMGYEYPLEATKDKLLQLRNSSHDKIYVAVSGTEVVGYVHANDYDVVYGPHMKNIMGIAVSKGWKRQGIGRMLLTRVEEWAKETGAAGVRLVSGAARTEAHAFYRSCGYRGDKMQLNLKKCLQHDL